MSLTLATCVIACAFCYGIYSIVVWRLQRRSLYELHSKLKGPPTLPIIGNAHQFIGDNEYLLNQFNKITSSYPSPCRVWLGPTMFVVICNADEIQAICLSPKTLSKGWAFEKFTRVLIGNGLISAPVSTWHPQRKLIQPAFNTKLLVRVVEIFTTQVSIMAEQLERLVDGPEFEIGSLLAACTLDMICESAMGVNVGAQVNGSSHFAEALHGVYSIFIQRVTRCWLWPDFIFYGTKLGKEQRKYSEYLHDFTDSVIQIRKQEVIERSSPSSDTNESEDHRCDSTPRRESLLDHLMELTNEHGKLSDQELHDEVITMVVAGNDSSATAVSFVMLMLALRPDVQDKVYRELYEIYGDADIVESPLKHEDFSRMQYLECVIKETLRLFPIVPYLLREVTADLDMGEYILPAGTTVVLGVRSVQRNEKYWPNPLKFDPDRFLPSANAKRHPFAYMAFSGGPRNCVGMKYAMMSMKTILATILRRYILKKDNPVPLEEMRWELGVLIKPVEPIKLRIEKRVKS